MLFSSCRGRGSKSAGGKARPGPPASGFWSAQDPLLHVAAESRRAAAPCGPRSGRRPTRGTPARASVSSTSSTVRLLATRNRAMSPTAFDDGVTLTMSPNSWLTSAYIRQMSGQRCARPERLGLLVQVGVLAAGHFVRCRRRRCWPSCRSRTARRTRGPLPSSRPMRLQMLEVEAGVAAA